MEKVVSKKMIHPLLSVRENSKKIEKKPFLVVSKKVSQKAVVRNKIRRLLRESLRVVEKEQAQKMCDITVRCFPAIKEADFKDVLGTLRDALTKR